MRGSGATGALLEGGGVEELDPGQDAEAVPGRIRPDADDEPRGLGALGDAIPAGRQGCELDQRRMSADDHHAFVGVVGVD